MRNDPSRRNPSDLSSEQRARVEVVITCWKTPEARQAEIRDREELAREYAESGDIATADLEANRKITDRAT